DDPVLGRLKGTDLASHRPDNHVRWVDAARLPGGPVRPNVPATIGVAIALGLALVLGLAFLLDYLDNTIKSSEDIESVLGMAFLGLIPKIADDKNGSMNAHPLHIVEHPKSMVAECCRGLRTNIM